MFFIINSHCLLAQGKDDEPYVTKVKTICQQLKQSGKMTLTLNECHEYQQNLSQVFFITVDDFGTKKNKLIHPLYHDFFIETMPSGIILTTKENRNRKFQRERLAYYSSLSKYPLFIGGDDCRTYLDNKSYRVKLTRSLNTCQSQITAAFAKISGCNFLFSPEIDTSVAKREKQLNYKKELALTKRQQKIFLEYGVFLTLKHFPTSPLNADSHKTNVNIKIPPPKMIKEQYAIFKSLLATPGFIMTTHIRNSLFDKTLLTFSKKWIDSLKKDVLGSKSESHLIVTDSLEMMISYQIPYLIYKDKPLPKNLSQMGAAGVLALLAGHDLIINRRSLKYQNKMFIDLLFSGLLPFIYSKELREQIKESANKVINFKNKYKLYLSHLPNVSEKNERYLSMKMKELEHISETDCHQVILKKVLSEIKVKK
jgi:hypothetical protein